MVMSDYLDVFREIMHNPRWKNDFDLIFRALFDNLGNDMIRTQWPALHGEHLYKILGMSVHDGTTQLLYFDETF